MEKEITLSGRYAGMGNPEFLAALQRSRQKNGEDAELVGDIEQVYSPSYRSAFAESVITGWSFSEKPTTENKKLFLQSVDATVWNLILGHFSSAGTFLNPEKAAKN